MKSGVVIYRFVRWILLAGGTIAFLLGLLLLFYIISGTGPFFSSQHGSIGLAALQRGIPVTATVDHPAAVACTISYQFGGSDPVTPGSAVLISKGPDAVVSSATLYLQPEGMAGRLIYLLPYLLLFFAVSFCTWHLSVLLSYIARGKAFHPRNFYRLMQVGWAMVILQGAFLALGSLHPFDRPVELWLGAQKLMVRPASHFDLGWTTAGCVVLVIAHAFRQGNSLQKEQELTV